MVFLPAYEVSSLLTDGVGSCIDATPCPGRLRGGLKHLLSDKMMQHMRMWAQVLRR